MSILSESGNVAIRECGEEMVDLDGREFILDPKYNLWGLADSGIIKLRKTVVEKLRQAQRALPKDYRLRIWDGFRTLQTQERLYVAYWNQLKVAHPDWSDGQIKEAVEIFVSPPSHDPTKPAPHNTGGAVDLTIVDANGVDLPMGTNFDEFNPRSYTDYFAHENAAMPIPVGLEKWEGFPYLTAHPNAFSAEEVAIFVRNRRLLLEVLEEVGFVNYEEEWWHVSYGDQYWAQKTGQSEAIYASVEL